VAKISLIAEFQCKPDRVQDFIARTSTHAGLVRANEPGCLLFHITQPVDGGDSVILYEVYADEAALEAHRGTPYMQEYRKDFAPMVENLIRRDLRLIDE
jgi:(4S)-4-hydroxy-5-phosphonooxypentane-2,3-dione isomerase